MELGSEARRCCVGIAMVALAALPCFTEALVVQTPPSLHSAQLSPRYHRRGGVLQPRTGKLHQSVSLSSSAGGGGEIVDRARGGGESVEALEKRRSQLTGEVLSFALPVLGACLVEPVLTLIDTWFVGNKLSVAASGIGLAALAANCALFNLITTSLSFFCTATTGVVAREIAKDEDAAGKALVNGLFLSTSVGAIIGALLLIFRTLVLTKGFYVSPETLTAASTYLSIRALSVPAALANYVGTGACLGCGDTITPLYSIIAAVLTNILGDWFFICVLKLGVAGAAAATALSSYVGAGVAVVVLSRKLRVKWGSRIPRLKELVPFLQISGALLVSSVLAGLTYSGTTRVVNSAGVVVESAAHQIGLQTWWLLSYFATPLSLAAQSIAPRELAEGRPSIARSLVNRIIAMALIVAGGVGATNWALPTLVPSMFTQDAAVAKMLQSVTFKALVAQVLITVGSVLDGVYIGTGRLRQYLFAGISSTAVAWTMLYYGVGLQGAWTALVCLGLARSIVNVGGLPRLYYKLGLFESGKEKFE